MCQCCNCVCIVHTILHLINHLTYIVCPPHLFARLLSWSFINLITRPVSLSASPRCNFAAAISSFTLPTRPFSSSTSLKRAAKSSSNLETSGRQEYTSQCYTVNGLRCVRCQCVKCQCVRCQCVTVSSLSVNVEYAYHITVYIFRYTECGYCVNIIY